MVHADHLGLDDLVRRVVALMDPTAFRHLLLFLVVFFAGVGLIADAFVAEKHGYEVIRWRWPRERRYTKTFRTP